MTQSPENEQKFTGLILLTGQDKPGIANALFQTLAEFAVQILDVEQLLISDRLILTVLISLNPAHQSAISDDLDECAKQLNVDIASLFSTREVVMAKEELIKISITTSKMHPKLLFAVTHELLTLGANLESINRISSSPLTLELNVSGAALDQLSKALAGLKLEDLSTVTVSKK